MTLVTEANKVDTRTLSTYDQIDGLKVIEELLLTRGEDLCCKKLEGRYVVALKELESMALIVYNLKVNATNKLHIGMRLIKFYLRNGLHSGHQDFIKVPKEIYDRVKQINDQYRKQKQ